ncbi:MAG: oligopeptidase A [Pseudohongiellaceae bacterium]
MSANPLLEAFTLPPFSRIRPEHVTPAVTAIVRRNLAKIDAIVQNNTDFDWRNLVQVMDDLDEDLKRSWSPVSHLNSVCNSEALRKVYNDNLPALADYHSSLGQNEELYQAYRQLQQRDTATLSRARQQVLENVVLDFMLSGVALPPEQKARFAQLTKRLSELSSRFSDNVLDATMAWTRHLEREDELQGLPESALAQGRQAAIDKNLAGYLFTLDIPSYLPVMTYADNRRLRRDFYEAYITRASDGGPDAGKWDNSPYMEEILALRHEMASLLGYRNYAELSLARKMAKTPAQVVDFLNELARKSHAGAKDEFRTLQEFASRELGLDELQPWDIPYASEKLRQATFNISQEKLRPWFPLNKVIDGMFEIVRRLYGIQFRVNSRVELWHPDAVYYDVLREGKIIAGFFVDLYAREHKKGGAWMDVCRVRRRLGDGSLQTPVAYLVCNFSRPLGSQAALLTHNEVTTLFHEFGHGLHHMLSTQEDAGVSGINGVAWDAVELPSQLMENWCWLGEAIPLISGHFETGAPLPRAELEKLLAAKNFQAGMQMMRQLEFALFDFRLHMEFEPGRSGQVQSIVQDVRKQVSVYDTPGWNRFETSFSHIFAGGYAAGYYSYKWAEVLSADVFEKFRDDGVLSREAGEAFLQSILAMGGSQPAMELFVNYRGREPDPNALLRASGIGGK